MQIEVKCPKCRYRFQAQAMAGETVLSCVCERCGTPFTFHLSEEEAASFSSPVTPPPIPSVSLSSSSSEERNLSSSSLREEKKSFSPSENHETESASSVTPPPIPREVTREHGGMIAAVAARNQDRKDFEAAALHPDRKVGGCAKGCIVTFVVALLLGGIGVYRLIHYFTSDSYEEQPTMSAVPASDGSHRASGGEADGEEEGGTDDFVEIKDEDPPSWLQGIWHGKAEYGDISMSIDAEHRQVSISVGSRPTKSGSFYYKKGKLHCEWKDGSEKTYVVDEENHTVRTGDGVELQQ